MNSRERGAHARTLARIVLMLTSMACALIAMPARAALTPEQASSQYGLQYLALWDAGNGAELYKHCSAWSKSAAADSSSYCRKPRAEFIAAVSAEAARCGPVVKIREGKPWDAKYERTAVHRDCPGRAQFIRIQFQGDGTGDIQSIDTNEFADGSPGSGTSDDSMVGPVLAGGGSLGVLLFIFVIIYVVIRARTQRQGRAWAAAASQLGLALEPWDPRFLSDLDHMRARASGRVSAPAGPVASQAMRGTVRGTPVTVSIQRHRGREPMTGAPLDSYTTTCRAFFHAPLAMGFAVGEKNFIGQIVASVMGTQALTTGNAAFDTAFKLAARNPQRAIALAQRVADAMIRASFTHLVSVSDPCVAIEMNGLVTDPRAIGASLESAIFLAQNIETANASLGP